MTAALSIPEMEIAANDRLRAMQDEILELPWVKEIGKKYGYGVSLWPSGPNCPMSIGASYHSNVRNGPTLAAMKHRLYPEHLSVFRQILSSGTTPAWRDD